MSSNTRLDLPHAFRGIESGATCTAWIGGIIVFEALRMIQRFDSDTQHWRRAFVVVTLVVTCMLVGTFGIASYHYAVDGLVVDPKMNRLKLLVRWHCALTRLAVLSGQSFYTHLLISSIETKSNKVLKFWKAACVALLIGNFGMSMVAVATSIQKDSAYVFAERRYSWKIAIGVQLLGGLLLTGITTYALLKSHCSSKSKKATESGSITEKPPKWNTGADKLLLACQTPIFTNILDAVALFLIDRVPLGVAYTFLYLSAEMHLLTPILALNSPQLAPVTEGKGPAPSITTAATGANLNNLLEDLGSFSNRMENRKMDAQRSIKPHRQQAYLRPLRSDDLDIQDRVPTPTRKVTTTVFETSTA